MGGTLTLHAPKIPVYISLVVHVFGNCDLVRWSTRRYAHRYGHDHDVDPFPLWQLWTTRKVFVDKVNESDLISMGFFPLINPLIYSLVGIPHIRDSKF